MSQQSHDELEAAQACEALAAGDPDASPEPSEALSSLRAAADALALSLPEAPAPDDLRARLLASVADSSERLAPFAARLARLVDYAREQGMTKARALLAEPDLPGRWEEAIGPGVELIHFNGGPATVGADVGSVRVAPGARFPVHVHQGVERALILQGRLREDDGQEPGPGDTSEMPAGSSHAFTSVGDEPLIYAVVVFGVEFPGLPDALKPS